MKKAILSLCLVATLGGSALADSPSDWLRRWNAEVGREIKLSEDDVLFKASDDPRFDGLVAAGFKQTDGTFLFGRLIWKQKAFSPMAGLGQVLSDSNFASLGEEERETLFLALLQQTYGVLGTRVYTGPPIRERERPAPLSSMSSPDGSARYQVWYYEYPVKAEEGEWREVLYFVSADGADVKARTLGSFRPMAERLDDFPEPSEELFE